MRARRILYLILAAWAATRSHARAESADEAATTSVELTRVPDGGIQPQVVAADDGIIHLLCFKGQDETGDLFYARLRPGQKEFGKPIRVNSQPGAAVAKGTIRGGQLAVGKEGRAHVVWNGSAVAEPSGPEGTDGTGPFLYASLNDAGTAFEPQRNLVTHAKGLDGGGSVAAGPDGAVYAVWHADGAEPGEEFRNVYMARSTDDGKTFAPEERINPDPTGACGCCSLRAFADAKGRLYVAYRAATGGVDRDSYLLVSPSKGRGFRSAKLGEWNAKTCPMSSYALAASPAGALVGWEFKGAIYYADCDPLAPRPPDPMRVGGKGSGRKHPAFAANARGERLIVWTEGTGWERGGKVAWQLYGADGKPIGAKGEEKGVPVWSFAAAFARADGMFVVLY